MKYSVVTLAVIIGVLAAGAVMAECATTAAPAAPSICVTSDRAITVDNDYVYVVQGNQVMKLRKSDLSVVACGPISAAEAARLGRGPLIEKKGTPLYPSGSEIDIYAPTGSTDNRVYGTYPAP